MIGLSCWPSLAPCGGRQAPRGLPPHPLIHGT